ncbi:hypothetical protein [Streptomyces sp. B1-3]|uniref:hypothetical protein n=1 Tax=Streptomyces sp. B1-3 TaxID=3141453 RepID=UPI003D2CACCB
MARTTPVTSNATSTSTAQTDGPTARTGRRTVADAPGLRAVPALVRVTDLRSA